MRALNRSIGILLILALTLSLMSFLPSALAAEEQPWVKYSGNPILSPSPDSWDSGFVVQPRVIYNGSAYKIWYVGGKSGVIAIGYADSPDGATWTKHGSPVLSPGSSGTWDSKEVALGSVYWNGTNYMMWYRGVSPTYVSGAIGLAISPDGITWAKYSGNPVMKPSLVDLRLIATPFVVKTSALYNMWYAARAEDDPPTSEVQRILYATSFDGIHWDKYTGVPNVAIEPGSSSGDWDSGSVYSPSLYYDGTNYGMWYAALDQTFLGPKIGFATSKDSTTWTKFPGNPVLTPGAQGSWDSVGVDNPSIVSGKVGFMLFYDGISPGVTGSIGFAQPPSGFVVPEFPQSAASMILLVTTLVAISMVSRTQRRPD